MNIHTPEQLRQAAMNTQQPPRNQAPVIYQAINNEKPGWRVGSLESSGQMNITGVMYE